MLLEFSIIYNVYASIQQTNPYVIKIQLGNEIICGWIEISICVSIFVYLFRKFSDLQNPVEKHIHAWHFLDQLLKKLF